MKWLIEDIALGIAGLGIAYITILFFRFLGFSLPILFSLSIGIVNMVTFVILGHFLPKEKGFT